MPFKVLFDGAYGIRSFGDDAPLIVMVEGLRQKLGPVDCAVVCRHADEDAYRGYDVRSIEGLEYATKAESLGRWFRGFNPDDDRSDLCHLYEEIASSDLLVLGAGNYLIDITIDLLKGPVPRFLLMSLMARMTGTPILWYGISVGPLKTRMGQDMSRLAASLASRITVRDKKSLRELSDLGITLPAKQLPDPVLGLTMPPAGAAAENPTWRAAHAAGRQVIAVSLRTIPGGGGISHEDYVGILAAACDTLVKKHDANILFIPQCIYVHATPDQDDRHTARSVISKMTQVSRAFSVEEELDVYQCAALYQGAFLAITTRLHGCVFAVLNHLPTVAINYNPKVSEFMNWIGLPEHCLSLNGLTADLLTAQTDAVLADVTLFRERSTAAIEAGKPLLEEYLNVAIDAMQEGLSRIR